jgi:hypothetical protein
VVADTLECRYFYCYHARHAHAVGAIANIVRDGYLLNQVHFYCNQFINEDEAQQQALIHRWITKDKAQYASI